MKWQYDYDRRFRFRLNDDYWECYLITEEEAEELDEDGFRAMTYTKQDGRCIFVVEGNVTKDIIAHELFHVYVSYFNLDSSGIDLDAFEEVIAEFLETSLDKFVRMRNRLYNKYKKLEGSK